MSNRARQTSDTSTKTTSTARKRKSQETFDGDEHDRSRRPRSTYDQMDIDEKPDITKLDAPSTGSSPVVPVAGPQREALSRGTVLSMRPTSFKKWNVDQMARRPGRAHQASIIPSQAASAPLNPAQGLVLSSGSTSSTPSGFQGLALPPPSAQPSQPRDLGSGSVFGAPFGFETLVPSEPAPTVQSSSYGPFCRFRSTRPRSRYSSSCWISPSCPSPTDYMVTGLLAVYLSSIHASMRHPESGCACME